METRDLADRVEYVPGRGAEEVARELGVDPSDLIELSSNENPHGPSPAAREAIEAGAGEVHHYPKSAHTDLTRRLADEWDVEPAQVWLSPGADGALDYLARAVIEPGDRVLTPDPGFAYYPMSARNHNGEVATYEVTRGDAGADGGAGAGSGAGVDAGPAVGFEQTPADVLEAYDGDRIVYLTSPHNPTGETFTLAEVRELSAAVADHTLLIVDEAYGEYSELPSAVGLVDDLDNVAVLRTFSKAYGLAGLRVGYAVVPESWADAYARVNTPFAVNELACRAGLAALGDDDHVERTVETARWAREYLRSELAAPTYESAGNFVLAAVGDGSGVAERAQRAGVIVRDCTSFGLPDCIRVSTGTRSETKRAVETLNDVLADIEVGPA
jgi:histidinol-phosphate aminotransferase